MRGTLSVAKDVNLTGPMWPDWEKDLDKKCGPEGKLGKPIAMAIEKQTASTDD